jgi:hypothetical protein
MPENKIEPLRIKNSKRQLPQIKTFNVSDYEKSEDLDKAVNNFVIESFDKENNYPAIYINGKFITVINDCIVETKR